MTKNFLIGISAAVVIIAVGLLYWFVLRGDPKPSITKGTSASVSGKLAYTNNEYSITANGKKNILLYSANSGVEDKLKSKVDKSISVYGELMGSGDNSAVYVLWIDGKKYLDEDTVFNQTQQDNSITFADIYKTYSVEQQKCISAKFSTDEFQQLQAKKMSALQAVEIQQLNTCFPTTASSVVTQ